MRLFRSLTAASIGVLASTLAHAASQSSWSGQFESMTGTSGKSFADSFGYSLSIKGMMGPERAKFVAGGNILFVPGRINIAGSNRNATLYGGTLSVGGALIPLGHEMVSPTLEVSALLGAHYLAFSSTHAGLPKTSMNLSYGVQAAFGVNIQLGKSFALRPFGEYNMLRSLKLGGQSNFELDSFGVGVALVFDHTGL